MSDAQIERTVVNIETDSYSQIFIARGEVIKFEFCSHSLWKPLYPFCSVCELCKILQKIFVSRLSLFLESSQALLKLESRYWKAFSTMSQRGIVASFSF